MKKLFLGFLFICNCLVASAATVTLAWDANTDNTTGYKVFGLSGGTTNLLLTTTGINNVTNTVTVNNGDWTFWVTAYNTNGEESIPSTTLLVKVIAAPAVVISAPNVLYVGNGLYNAAFSWTPPLTEYYVTNFIARLTKPNGTVETQNTGTNRSVIFSSLSNGSYNFTVTPVNFGINGTTAFYNFSIIQLGQPKNFRVRTN